MNTRIREVRKENKLTQEELGKLLGTSRDTITSIENCRTSPSGIFINLFCEKFKLNKNWLLTGTGEKFISDISDEELISDILADITLNDSSRIKSIIKNLVSLDEEYLELIEKLILGLKK